MTHKFNLKRETIMNNFIYSKLFIFNIEYEETIYLNFKMLFKSKKLQVEIVNIDFFQNFRNKIKIQNIEICLFKFKIEDILKTNW